MKAIKTIFIDRDNARMQLVFYAENYEDFFQQVIQVLQETESESAYCKKLKLDNRISLTPSTNIEVINRQIQELFNRSSEMADNTFNTNLAFIEVQSPENNL